MESESEEVIRKEKNNWGTPSPYVGFGIRRVELPKDR